MWKEIEELLKNKYDSYNTYLDNMEDIKDIYNFCIEKYHYLGFSDEIWYKLIYEAIKKNIAKDELIGEIFKTIDFKIERYIKKKLRTRNYAFLNVLLKKIYFENGEKNNRKILRDFYNIFYLHGIDFDDEFFALFKEKSPLFQNILKSLQIEEFSNKEIKNLIKGKYDFYFKIKPPFRSIIWTKEKFLEINFLLDNKIILKDLKSNNILKVKYILLNYNLLLSIKKLYLKYFPDTKEKFLDKVLVNLSLEELHKLKEDYLYYKTFSINNTNIPDFIIKFNNKINNITLNKESKKKL